MFPVAHLAALIPTILAIIHFSFSLPSLFSATPCALHNHPLRWLQHSFVFYLCVKISNNRVVLKPYHALPSALLAFPL